MNNNELGYNYLNTSFTGTKSTFLSGSNKPDISDFILPCDSGVAGSLNQFELKNYFDIND